MYIPIFCALYHHKRGQPYGAGYGFYMKCFLYVCCLANGRLRRLESLGNGMWLQEIGYGDKPLRYIITLTPYFLAPFSFYHIISSSASFL